jgi:hypothetical protein
MARFSAQAPTGVDVQQLETMLRTAIFKPANALIGYLLQEAANRIDALYQPKPGQKRKGRESLTVHGIFGNFVLLRDYYYHAGKKEGHYPADSALGLEGDYTPALARLICLEGADEASYQKASNHLLEVGAITVPERQIHRTMQRIGEAAVQWQKRESLPGECDAKVMYVSADGTGVPMRRSELENRQGKQPDGSAKTRLVYLGCVFTQHKEDDQGQPIRDWQSTTYLSSLDRISDFGLGLRREALRRGMHGAKEIVFLVDGANGLEKLGKDYFADAVQIVDFYHAMEHLQELLEVLWGKDHPRLKRRRHHWAKLLLNDGVERIIASARRTETAKNNPEALEKALGYFESNVARMRYGTFRRKGYFIGSGVIEAGCKTIIGSRCKQSGMFWSRRGADGILAFRCIHHSRRLDSFWKDRLNDLASANDSLALSA